MTKGRSLLGWQLEDVEILNRKAKKGKVRNLGLVEEGVLGQSALSQ